VILGNDASPADIAAMRQQMGLDRPLLVQFVSWFGGILTAISGIRCFSIQRDDPLYSTWPQRLRWRSMPRPLRWCSDCSAAW
jgi:ABC-type dipeptide/oligopeptide/nickel transport system permease component